MPIYDTKCSQCGYETRETVRIADLDLWDLNAKCPTCNSDKTQYHRIIKQAPVTHGFSGNESHGKKKKHSFQKTPLSQTCKDEMRHESSKRVNKDQLAEGLEKVRTGAFEGF